METTYEEWKQSGEPEISPLGGSTYYTSHGTHVSGTIAGQGKTMLTLPSQGLLQE